MRAGLHCFRPYQAICLDAQVMYCTVSLGNMHVRRLGYVRREEGWSSNVALRLVIDCGGHAIEVWYIIG
jgi:hypothetical protein